MIERPWRARVQHRPIGRAVPAEAVGAVALDAVPVEVERRPLRAAGRDGGEVGVLRRRRTPTAPRRPTPGRRAAATSEPVTVAAGQAPAVQRRPCTASRSRRRRATQRHRREQPRHAVRHERRRGRRAASGRDGCGRCMEAPGRDATCGRTRPRRRRARRLRPDRQGIRRHPPARQGGLRRRSVTLHARRPAPDVRRGAVDDDAPSRSLGLGNRRPCPVRSSRKPCSRGPVAASAAARVHLRDDVDCP